MQILDILARVEDEAPFDMFDGRFVYRSGFSGRRYLHTVYAPEDLDAYTGGVAVLIGERNEVQHVLLIEDGAAAFALREGAVTAQVHFPKTARDAVAACNDLRAVLGARLAAL